MNAPFHVFGVFGSAGSVVAALVIGLAFGWFLERGGLGSARKLAGQFYLTDLTVFRVLFTALVTAMLGVFWLARLGVLEPRLLDIPHTFLAPILVGGIVFGVGFLLGGLCPGTSCVSASSGRIDGMLVMLGMFLGVLAFMELHPVLEAFHNTTPRGVSTLPGLLGAGPGLVVAVVTLGALGAFAVSERIDGGSTASGARTPLIMGAAVLAVGAFLPLGNDVVWPGQDDAQGRVESLTLARELMDGARDLRVVDVRGEAAFENFRLPLAENVPLEMLGQADFVAAEHTDPHQRVVVYGFDTTDGQRARVLLEGLGMTNVQVLEGGAVGWLRAVMVPVLPDGAGPEARARFQEVAELSRYFGGEPRVGSATDAELGLDQILAQARRASCGW